MEGKVKGIIAVLAVLVVVAFGLAIAKNGQTSSLQSDLSAANASIASIQKELKASQDELSESQKTLSEAQEVQAALEQKETELAAKDEELTAANDQLKEAQSQLDAAIEASGAKEAEYTVIQDELAGVKAQLTAQEEEVAAAKADVTAKEDELANVKADSLAKEEELAAVKAELELKSEEVAAVNASLEVKENERTIANARLGEKEVAIANVEAKLSALEEELVGIQGALTAKNDELMAINETIAAREQQLNDLLGQMYQLITVPGEEAAVPSDEVTSEEEQAEPNEEETAPGDMQDSEEVTPEEEEAQPNEEEVIPEEELISEEFPTNEDEVFAIDGEEDLELEVAPIDETTVPAVIGTEQEAADETVVGVVNGQEILYAQVRDAFMENLPQYEMYTDVTDAEIVRQLLETELDTIIERNVIENKAAALNVVEDAEAFYAEAETIYNEIVDQYVAYFGASDGSSEEDMRAMAVEYLNQFGYTVDALAKSLQEENTYEKLREYAAQDVKVEESAVRAAYDEQVAAAMAEYAEDLYGFEYEVHEDRDAVLYYPEGYRLVKHILLPFGEEQQVEATELLEQLKMLEADDPARADVEAKLAAIVETFQPTIDEIMQAYEAGTDFNALVAQYGDDPGMEEGALTANGYYVSSESVSWEKNFQDGAMSIEKVGDVSAPVVSGFGIHIIRYESDVTPGAVPFEEAAPIIEAGLLSQMADEAYATALEAWRTEANIELFKDRLVVMAAEAPTEEPTEAEEPAEVVEPTDAEEPAEVVEPAEAEEPAEVVEPTDAEEPAEVVEPADAEEPAEVVEPADAQELAGADATEETGESTESDTEVEPTETEVPAETEAPAEDAA